MHFQSEYVPCKNLSPFTILYQTLFQDSPPCYLLFGVVFSQPRMLTKDSKIKSPGPAPSGKAKAKAKAKADAVPKPKAPGKRRNGDSGETPSAKRAK